MLIGFEFNYANPKYLMGSVDNLLTHIHTFVSIGPLAGSCWFGHLHITVGGFQSSAAYFTPAVFSIDGGCLSCFVHFTTGYSSSISRWN